MTTYVTQQTECDICGIRLAHTAHVTTPGMTTPEARQPSRHFRFDTCPECEVELLKAKDVLCGVMTLKRQNAPAETRGEDVLLTKAQWEDTQARAYVNIAGAMSPPMQTAYAFGGGGGGGAGAAMTATAVQGLAVSAMERLLTKEAK